MDQHRRMYDLQFAGYSFSYSFVPSASPTEQFFTQSTGLYVGGNADAFHSRFPAPVTLIVSLAPRPPLNVLTDSFCRRSSSSLSELVRVALSPWLSRN